MDYSHNAGSLATSALESTNNPPSSNRGVRILPPAKNTARKGVPSLALDPLNPLNYSFFDWYQVAVDMPVYEVIPVIEQFYLPVSEYPDLATKDVSFESSEGAFVLCPVRGDWLDNPRQPPYLYSKVLLMPLDGDRIKTVQIHWGGINGGTFIRATSDQARSFASFVRATWPDHSVSRADIAMDFCEPGAFESLWRMGVAIAENFSVKIERQGDWDTGKGGRTLYIGSRESVVFIRIYEKGYERQKAGVSDAPLDWVRFEIEVKPAKAINKRKAATMEPVEFFATSKALRYVATVLQGLDLEPVQLHSKYRPAEFTRSLNHMCYQYHDVLFKFMDEICSGDEVEFAHRLLSIAAEQRDAKKSIRKQIDERAKATSERRKLLDR